MLAVAEYNIYGRLIDYLYYCRKRLPLRMLGTNASCFIAVTLRPTCCESNTKNPIALNIVERVLQSRAGYKSLTLLMANVLLRTTKLHTTFCASFKTELKTFDCTVTYVGVPHTELIECCLHTIGSAAMSRHNIFLKIVKLVAAV